MAKKRQSSGILQPSERAKSAKSRPRTAAGGRGGDGAGDGGLASHQNKNQGLHGEYLAWLVCFGTWVVVAFRRDVSVGV